MKCAILGVKLPHEMVGGIAKLVLLMWGSPLPCISNNEEQNGDSWCGTKYFDHTPKTEAFEQMMWLAPHAIVVMSLSDMYRCEFFQPQWHHYSTERQLIVAKAYMAHYIPMRSSSVKVDVISGKKM